MRRLITNLYSAFKSKDAEVLVAAQEDYPVSEFEVGTDWFSSEVCERNVLVQSSVSG